MSILALVFAASLLTDLNNHAIPLSEMAAFGSAVSQAQIVGLGEATHGGHEVAETKIALFRELVKHDGFRTLAIEGDWSEWLPIDDYLQTGKGDATTLLIDQDYSVYRTHEMLDLVQWMRSYNIAHPKDILHIVGIDMQEPAKTYALLAPAVKIVDPTNAPKFTQCYTTTAYMSAGKIDTSMRAECVKMLSGILPALRTKLEVEVANALLRAEPVLLSPNARDALMASNVALLHKNDTKIAIWAHDGHVTMYDNEHPKWIVMGEHLHQQFGSLYYSVGTIMGRGSIRARPEPGQPAIIMPINHESTSAALLFNGIGQPFFLDIRTLPVGPLVQWLNEPQTLTLAGGSVSPGESMLDTQELARSFDGLVYLPAVSPTNPL